MHRKSRSHVIRGTWFTGGLVVVLGAAGLRAQEVVDLPGEDLPLSADLELVYSIGSAAAESDWEQFSSIRNVGFDGARNLYLLDGAGMAAASRVVVVDAAGRYVNDFGRAGDGPGEFRAATQLVVWADGQILIEDMMHQAYHVFDPGGEFERMVREAGAGGGFGIASRPGLRPERTGSRTLIGRDGRTILRVDMSSGDVTERTLVEPWTPPGREDQGPRAGEIEDMIDEVWGFEPDVLFDVLPAGGVAFSDSSAYAIKLTDPTGAVERVLRRPIRPLAVTEEMRSAERERRLEQQRNRSFTSIAGGEPPPQVQALMSRMRTAQTAAVENMRFFTQVPVIAAVRSTWDGTLWVQRSTEPGREEPGPIDVLAPDGRYVGTLETGTAALPDMPDAFGPDGLVAFLDTDEFDVPVITVRRLPPEIR
ncbi:hypothetical protein [Candidatus Palauibacter sp.]|uniref:hypothetical protein n=1 Tax=Candidatus Palauibacter sp. TaxID=3101350 RepID=UPI003CC66CA9